MRMGTSPAKPAPRLRRGTVLLQTLVISVIISMIAVMVMKWTLARYTLASRVQRSAVAQSRAAGCVADRTSRWNLGTAVASGGCETGVANTVTCAGGSCTMVVRIDE